MLRFLPLFGLLAGFLFILWLLSLLSRKLGDKPSSSNLPFGLKDLFLTRAELDFYRILVRTIEQGPSPRHRVFVQVPLSALINKTVRDRTAWNKIDRLRLDYLICDADTLQPVLAIELDDSSHLQEHRQRRDRWLREVLDHVGLPFKQIPVNVRGYSPQQITGWMAEITVVEPAPAQS